MEFEIDFFSFVFKVFYFFDKYLKLCLKIVIWFIVDCYLWSFEFLSLNFWIVLYFFCKIILIIIVLDVISIFKYLLGICDKSDKIYEI